MHKVTFAPTPNPKTYRFSLPETGVESPITFNHPNETNSSPLARKIFGFPWVESILLGSDFIAVTKQDWVEWELLAEPLAQLIQEHIELGIPLYQPVSAEKVEEALDVSHLPPELREIHLVVQKEIRPILALDGGDVQLVKLEHNILYVKLQGACVGCPSTQITLKEGIEVRLKELFPTLQAVELVT